MKFYSKIDWWFYTLLGACTLLLFFLLSVENAYIYAVSSTLCFFLLLAIVAVLLPAMVGTYYELGRDGITIHCGLFYIFVAYQDIISITNANNMAVSPALSKERLEIHYFKLNGRGIIYISPHSRDDFLQQLNVYMNR